ncbi:MAG TPA: DUF4012 domain-containing protein [Candidatus Paceibacterota bacterium]|nr:DUF4012 domain-containing protein [Candidatus Paceibacterota bacterium]
MPKKRVPIRNIDPVLVDIRKPGLDYKTRFMKSTNGLNLSRVPHRSPTTHPLYVRIIGWSITSVALLILAVAVFALFNLKGVKVLVSEKSGVIFDNFASSFRSLKELDPAEASSALSRNSEELSNLMSLISRPDTKTLLGLLGGVIPAVKDAGNFFVGVTELNIDFLKLSNALYDLELNGFGYFQTDGAKLVQSLSDIKDLIGGISRKIEKVRNTASTLKMTSPFFADTEGMISGDYLKYSAELMNFERLINGLSSLLGSTEGKRILLLFQNPAEMRPAGGFLGSYGDLTVKYGQMSNLTVQDIYWPDHPMNFDLKVIPPEPLQAVTKDWGARDANWFFDFPTSARTVASMLEASNIYKKEGVKFDAVVGLNISVVETILDIIGPIDIPDYGLKIGADNFLVEIQREVETGRDKKPGQNPKKILSVITPVILEKLGTLEDKDRVAFIEAIKDHFKKKDIMVYSEDGNLSSFFESVNIDGGVFELPNNFWGTYLALVNANVAGGKSDAFILESAEVRVDVDTDGGVFTEVAVTRKHEGNTQKDPWWRAANQNYFQVFASPGSTIVSLKGNDIKKYEKPVYDQSYEVNADLKKIEDTKVFLSGFDAWTMDAFGKTIFATWWNVPAGKSETLTIRYQTPRPGNFVLSEGAKFKFVFERQSGVKNGLRAFIGAPLGYEWAESKDALYTYETDDPDARMVIDLTLVKSN